MNLNIRKARAPIAVLGACALVAGGGWLASSAFADAAPLALNTGGSSPVVGNFGITGTARNAAYGLRITSGTDSGAIVKVGVDSTPTAGAKLFYKKGASNAAADTLTFNTSVQAKTSETVAITFTGGAPTTGSVLLAFNGGATTSFAASTDLDTAAHFQAKLESVAGIGTGNVVVSGASGGPYTITFQGDLGGADVGAVTKSSDSLDHALNIAATDGGVSSASASTSADQGGLASVDYLYVTGDQPGAYKFHVWQDNNNDGTVDADERSTGDINLTVYDTKNTTTSTSDDVSPVIGATTPVSPGLGFKPTITYDKSLSLTDARGTGSTGLQASLAALTYTSVDGGSDASGTGTLAGITDTSGTDALATYTPSTRLITFPSTLTPAAAGYVVLRSDFTSALGSPAYSSGSKVVTVQSNLVTQVTLDASTVNGKVKPTGTSDDSTATAVSVSRTSRDVTYTAQVTVSSGVMSGKTVYFTLAGTDVTSLTTDGTTVDATNHIFSATTDADGKATLKVTNGASTLGSYTVQASSNGDTSDNNVGSGNGVLTATYSATGLGSIDITSTTADLTQPTTATSVTIKGKLTDTFGAAYTPGSSDPSVVTVTYGSTTTTTPLASDGTFSYAYTPATTPTAGSTTPVTFTYTPAGGSLTSKTATIQFSSSAAPNTITLSAPTAGATPTLLTKATPTGVAVTGTVYDSGNAALAYKTVALSGDGVYFSTVASPTLSSTTDDLTKTFTTTTNASGVFTAYAFYTKPGAVTVTATSGGKTGTAAVTVSSSIDPYKIVVNDAKGKAGSNITVSGKVTDVFGNGVPGNKVNLALSSSSAGTLSASDVTTTSDGTFSATLAAANGAEGDVTVTGTLYDHSNTLLTSSTALIPSTAYKNNDGLTLENGDYQDEGTITVVAPILTLEASPHLSYGSKYYARGALISGEGADANATVDIYSKLPGGSFDQIDSVKADETGRFGAAEHISKSTYFLVKSGGLSSSVEATRVISGVILTATSPSHGKVHLMANGGPNAEATLTFYRVYANGDTKRVGSKLSNAGGNGSITVSAPKGTRKYLVTFKAPGTTHGDDTVTVKVK